MPSALPKPPAEVPVCRELSACAPKFRLAVDRTLYAMRAEGFDPVVAETLRTRERQAFLYGFGRTYDDGRGIVTKAATAALSWHGYGLAADIISRASGWNARPAFWEALGLHALAHGLTWGGTWKARDLPHVQWGKCRQSPSARATSLFAAGAIEAVWREVDAA